MSVLPFSFVALLRTVAVGAAFACLLGASAPVAGARTLSTPPDRGDLAAGYTRFDRLVASLPNDPLVRERASRCFDGLTSDFFAGRYDAALAELARTYGELRRLNEDGQEEQQFLFGRRYEISPRAIVAGAPAEIRIESVELSRMQRGDPPRRFVAVAGSTEHDVAFADEVTLTLLAIDGAATIEIFAEFPLSGRESVGRVAVLEAPLEEIASRYAERLAALQSSGSLDGSSLASLRARIGLLTPVADRTRSASLLADLSSLVPAIGEELKAAEAGMRPYRRDGDLWRIYKALGTELPTRQFIPEGDGPFPLVIALHGAGGDENMFFEGYGAGVLRKFAAGQGAAVVCPPTIPFGVSPNLLDAFIDEVALDAPIDRGRVVLLGHSLGGVTASRLSVLKPERIAGVVCIAGFSDLPRTGIPAPRKVYLGALDPLFPLESTTRSIEAARLRGESIEVEVLDREGHTLVVGPVIPHALEWLLARPARQIEIAHPIASEPSTSPMKTDGPAPAPKDASPSSGPMK
ncbi:MAG: alpha/beta fold hydrolase [Phycisphaera sp.]|nr:alpha/beta fold hydrolase [Phycisphaera sp.]